MKIKILVIHGESLDMLCLWKESCLECTNMLNYVRIVFLRK